MSWDYPISFYFQVQFQNGNKKMNIKFREVSGLQVSRQSTSLDRGGDNENRVQIPDSFTHTNVVLKRALEPLDEEFTIWVKKSMSLYEKIETMNMMIFLMNSHCEAVACWFCGNAYPVKWEISSFDAMRSELAIESLEMSYEYFERKK
ncbi:MAG: phage tail protein [Culturomica sp.]|jgi:phage tail-like protein|nr:phage tail protein [Culturomica sp.]